MTNLRTLAVIAFTASILAALGGCANKQGDLGTDYQPTPEIRSHPDFVPARSNLADTIAQSAKAEVIDLAAAKPAPAGDVVSLPGSKTSSKDEAVAELVSLRPIVLTPVPAVQPITGADETKADGDKPKPPTPPTPPPIEPPKSETPEERASRLLKDAERLSGVEGQANTQEAEAAFQAGLRLFNDLEYEDAKKQFERAVRLSPGHSAAQEKLHTVNALLGVRVDILKRQFMELERAERVKMQETMMSLAQSMEEARRLEERGSANAVEVDPIEKERALTEQLDLLRRAQERYRRVREIINWMPPSFELPGLRAQVDGAGTRVKEKIAAKEDEISFLRRMHAQEEADKERRKVSDEYRARINKMLDQVKELFDQRNYKASERLSIRILQIDPLNECAEGWKNKSRAAYHTQEAGDVENLRREEYKRSWEDLDEASISYFPLVLYPPNWDQINKRSEGNAIGKQVKEESWKAEIRKKLQRKVTFEFVDTPLEEAIGFLRGLANVTMIVDPKVVAGGAAPAINLRVTDMSLDLALEWILKLADLEYALQDSAIYISKPNALIQTVELRIYDVSDLTQTIHDFPGPEFQITVAGDTGGGGGGLGGTLFTPPTQLTPTTANIAEMIRNRVRPESWDAALGTSIEERAGRLVVMQRPEIHALVDQLLSNFRATQKMMINIESRFLTIREAYLEDIGVEFQGLDPNVLFGDFGDIRRLGAPTGLVQPRVPGGTDSTPPNAPFPGFVNAGRNGNIERGNFTQVGSIINHTIGFFNNDPDTVSGNDVANTVRQGGFSGQLTILNNTQVQAFVRALAVRENQSTLIAPRLTVFNTQRAHMFVARQQSYVADYEISGDSYDPVVRQFLVGVVLDVKPIVSSDRRYVTLELRPTVTELVNFQTRQIDSFAVNSGANVNIIVNLAFPIQFPELSIRRVRTTATVPDGGILLIGGLYRNIRFNAENGVPFLSDLPVIGRLFRWNTVDNAKSNLAILVSPRIILFNEEEDKL